MAENSYLRRHWKVMLNIATFLAMVILVYAVRQDLATTFENLFKVHAIALVLLLPIEFLNYDAQARLYQRLFKLLGNSLSYKLLFKASLELNFINGVFPSGGVSGISYFGIRMRSDEVTGGKATVVQLLKLGIIYISFELLLILGLLFMAIGGRVNDVTILVATAISTLLVIGTFVFVMIIGSHHRINASFEYATKTLNNLIHLVRPKHPETISFEKFRRTINELHNNYLIARDNYRKLMWPLIWATVANATEVLAVYAVFVAFGHWVNIGDVILAYAVANFAGLISVLPGGIGIYEGLMTGVLAAAGVSAGLTLPVVVMYRILNTIIQVPPGYYYYHKAINAGPKDLKHNART